MITTIQGASFNEAMRWLSAAAFDLGAQQLVATFRAESPSRTTLTVAHQGPVEGICTEQAFAEL